MTVPRKNEFRVFLSLLCSRTRSIFYLVIINSVASASIAISLLSLIIKGAKLKLTFSETDLEIIFQMRFDITEDCTYRYYSSTTKSKNKVVPASSY